MSEEFKIGLGVELDEGSLNSIKDKINSLSDQKIKLDVEVNQDSAKKLAKSIEKGLNATKIDTSNLSKQLAESFNLDKSVTKKIKAEMDSMIKSLSSVWNGQTFDFKNAKGFYDGLDNLEKMVTQNAKVIKSKTGIYDDFFNYFKDKKIYISDALKSAMGDDLYKEISKANIGKIVRDATKGISIDSIWGEMTSLFPEHFSANITNQVDQIIHAFDLMKKAREDVAQTLSVTDLTGGQYKDALDSIGEQLVSAARQMKDALETNIKTGMDASKTTVELDIEINKEKIISDIRDAVKSASSTDGIDIKLNIDNDSILSEMRSAISKIDDGEPVKINVQINRESLQSDLNIALDDINLPIHFNIDTANLESQIRAALADIQDLEVNLHFNTNRDTVQSPQFDASGLSQIERMLRGVNSAGRDTQNVFNSLGNSFREAFSAFTLADLITDGLYKIGDAARTAADTTKEFNEIETDLMMATGESRNYIKGLMNDYNTLGQEIGAVTSDVAKSADSWLRQGRSMSETNQLIKDSMILSKDAKLSSEDASEVLTATLNGYQMAAEQASHINDVLTSIDLKSASDAGGIGTALTKTASMAHNAGVSLEKTAAIIATVKDVTQQSDATIGTAINSIFSRMNNIKVGKFVDDETGEALNDTEKVLKEIGISMRDVNGQFVDSEITLNNVAQKWNTLDKNTQKAVATAMAGTRQMNSFIAMMDNWDKVQSLTETALTSDGTAQKKFEENYLSSLEAKTNALKASLESLSTSVITDDMFAGFLDGSKAIVDFVDNINLVQSAIAGLGAAGGIYAVQQLVGAFRDLSAFSSALDLSRVTNMTDDMFSSLLNLSQGLSESQTRLLLSSSALSEAQRVAILMNQGMSAAEAQTAVAAMGLASAEGTATAATFSLAGAFKGLWATLMANPLILVVAGVTAAVSAFSAYKNAVEESRQAAQQAASSYSEQNTSLQSQIDRIRELREELASGTLSEMQAYQAKQELLSIQQQLADSYGVQVAGIDLVNGSLETQIDLINQLSAADASNYLTKNMDEIAKAEKEMTKTLGGDGSWITSAGEYLGTFYDSADEQSKRLKDIIAKYKENITMDDNGDGSFNIRFVGDVTDAENVLVPFMTDIRQFEEEVGETDILSTLFSNSESVVSEADDIIEKYQEIYETAKQARMIEESYGENKKTFSYGGKDESALEWLGDYTDAIKAYNDALASGEGITEAKNNFTMLDTAVQSLLKNEDFAEYSSMFEEVRAQLNDTTIANNEFLQSMDGSAVNKQSASIKECTDALKSLEMTDTQFKDAFFFDTDNVNEGTEAVKGLVEAAQSMGLVSMDVDDAGLQDFINMLIDAGVLIQDKSEQIRKATEEELSAFRDTLANNEIQKWFDRLPSDDKKLVYEIGVKSDDTTLYTLTRWKTELESMKETGKTTGEQMQSFYDIINNTEAGNFSDYVDSYTKKISTLQDALSKLDLGEMSQADKIDMAMTFPELAPYINDTDALKNAIQDLINTSNQDMNSMIDEMIAELAETAPEAAAALEAVKEALNGLISTDGGFNFDIDAEIERFNKLYDAMKESVSGTGLSTEGIANVKAMFQDLEGYDPSVLFERTEHGIHLNTTALRALQSQYESTKKLDIQTELQNLKQEYNDSAKAVEGLSDAEAKRVLQQKGLRSTDAILEDIQNVQTLAAQYEGLTSAYNKWIMAQSAGEEGDMYDNVTGSLKDIKQLYDDGLVGTNAFRSAVQMMTNEDLSTANIDKLISVYESGYPAMKRYFTDGQEGAITFLEDIQNINSEWAHMNQDGSWDIDFGIGNDEEIANAISEMTGLQVSTEEVQMIMRKLSDYGFDIKLDSAYSSIDELKSRIEETEGKLKELGQEPVDINIYAEGEEAQTELDKAKQKIEEIKNSDASIEVKTAQLEDAYAKVDVLVAKVNQPAFMSIDVSQVDSELQGALTTLQEYQTAVNNLNALEIKGADTSEIEAAKGKVDELAGKIQELPDDVKTKIGLETDGSIEDIKSQISNDEVKITVTADTTQATTDISNIEGEEVEVKVETSGNEALDNLKSALEELEDKNIKVTADVEGLEDVKTLSDSVKNVESKEATATVTSVGKDDAVALSDAVEKIINKNATATVTSVGKDDAIALSQAVENITDKTVTATANTIGKDDVDALKASIDSLYDRTVTSTAKVIGTNLVIALKSAIDSLYSKTVSAGANVFGTSAVWALKSAIDSLYSKTVTATTVTRQVAGVDGTAHAQGTAFVKGDWGTKESGVALGGELGQELIVRDGHFFTIGDDAAEFFKYKKGDIIFNAEQTKQIFEKGKITHGVKRGKALVEGTAFSSGSGRFTQSGNTVTSSSAARRNNSSSSGSSGGSSNSSSSSSSEKEFEETFDWIEIKIARIERAIESLNKKASSTYRSWSNRNKNLVKEISKVESEMKIQQSGYDRYMKQAKAVGLDEKWAKKVRNGTIDISTIKDEDLADKIKKYQEWYEKALACQDAIEDLKETEAELYKTAFDNVSKKYENILSSIGHEQSMLEEYISQSEEKGYITSTKYYEALMKNERSQISKLQKEKTALIAKMNEAVNSGAITQGSEAWYEMANQIDEVTLAIEQGNTALIEYSNAIRDIKWQIFDLIEERISNVTTEAQFLIDLLSSKDLFTDKGQLTNEGKSAMGLHAVNYNVYMSQADDYAKEMENVNKKLAKDPANLELAERRQELLELQQEMILAAEDEKEAIVDMVKEGIELELDALKDLIDKYEDAIDAQKDLYDYENKIKDKTAEIASLQKQIQAYSGDTSEETKATVQKLKVSLENAQKDLESTQYDKYISDQKKLLDELYNDYEMTLNMRLDNIDGLISDMIKAVNDSSGTIANTIYSTAASVGYTLSESMDNIWKEALAGSQADGQQRVSQTTSILSQLVANGKISSAEAENILAALGSGDAAQAQQALEQIQQLVANGNISKETANQIIAALSLGNQQQTLNALNTINKLTETGQLSTNDANNIIQALVTGDAGAIQNAQNIINRLVANGALSQEDAQNIIKALNDSASTNKDIVTIYGSNFSSKLTTTNEALASIKSLVQSILQKMDSQAATQVEEAHTSSVVTTTTQKPTTTTKKPTTTTKKPTTTTKKPTTTTKKGKTTKQKYGVALAIIEGNYGWGTGSTRVSRLKAKGFDANEIQSLVNKLVAEGYVNSGAWVGRYQGITDLSPYHYNKFAMGVYKLDKDQLAWTQEKGTEYIMRPDGSLLTPLTRGTNVFNADASENLWDIANYPSEFIKDALGLNSNGFTTPVIQNTNGDTFTGDMNVSISLPNVSNYEQFKYQMQHDKSFEKMIKAMTVDRLFGGSSLKKYKC